MNLHKGLLLLIICIKSLFKATYHAITLGKNSFPLYIKEEIENKHKISPINIVDRYYNKSYPLNSFIIIKYLNFTIPTRFKITNYLITLVFNILQV
jgi:hypothetical protein